MPDSVAGEASIGNAALPRTVTDLVGVVLAAGEGRRLRPLTNRCPKALCPVGNVALVDLALDRLAAAVGPAPGARAVNLHHGRAELDQHLDRRADAAEVHRSIEGPVALGTAGALGQLRPWIDGRAALVVNADSWTDADLAAFVDGWDGERVRLLITGDPHDAAAPVEFGPRMGLVASLLPWSELRRLEPVPSGLYETMWEGAHRDGGLETVGHRGRFVDCGTPADYLRANLEAVEVAGGSIVADDARVGPGAADGSVERSVVGPGAVVRGSIDRCVLWAGAEVAAGERLVRTVRTPDLTVTVEP